jgi:hypothetical protein
MKQIGDALNILPRHANESDYPLKFRWEYHDVLTVEEGCQNGFPQVDSHSCGVIWMMIVWFVVTRERAPTLQDLRELPLGGDSLGKFRAWVAYSILQDKIWFTPDNTDFLHHKVGPKFFSVKLYCDCILSWMPASLLDDGINTL